MQNMHGTLTDHIYYIVHIQVLKGTTKVVHGSSQGGPNGPLWALCKK